jgi:hypothetical protein
MKTPALKTPIATTTGELFLPTRLIYEVYDTKRLSTWLKKTSCVVWDTKLQRWTWLHIDDALKMKFPSCYDKLPANQKPVVLASCYLVNNQTFHVYTRCGLRAVKFLAFFDRQVSHSIAVGAFMDQYNLITTVTPGAPLPVPEDYFKDESKIEFRDLIGLMDSPDSPAKKAMLNNYFADMEHRTLSPLERHRLDDFYQDGPEIMEKSIFFRELMARQQYQSDKPIRILEAYSRERMMGRISTVDMDSKP